MNSNQEHKAITFEMEIDSAGSNSAHVLWQLPTTRH